MLGVSLGASAMSADDWIQIEQAAKKWITSEQDGRWWLFDGEGEYVVSGATFRDLCVNIVLAGL